MRLNNDISTFKNQIENLQHMRDQITKTLENKIDALHEKLKNKNKIIEELTSTFFHLSYLGIINKFGIIKGNKVDMVFSAWTMDFNNIKSKIINSTDLKKMVEHLKFESSTLKQFNEKINKEISTIKVEENKKNNIDIEEELKKVR